MSAADRTSLALPIDVARTMFDATATQVQLNSNTFQGAGDDTDLLYSYIEDAEHEFRNATNRKYSTARVGVPGTRETYEQPTYKLSGHKLTKGTYTGVWSEYLPEQKTIPLDNDRVLPFDSTEGDAVFVYRGMDGGLGGGGWEDVTDEQGELWDVLDHRSGTFTFSPVESVEYILSTTDLARGTFPSFLKRLRFAVTYRYGGLGGSSDYATSTELDATVNDSDTTTLAVADGSRFPSDGTKVLRIGSEYVVADLDPANDEIDLLERGVRGTDGASHSSGDTVAYVPPSVRKAVAARAGMQLVQAGRYSAWLPESEDAIDKGDMIDEMQATWDATVAALSE